MKRHPYKPSIGTISHGTLRDEDLLDAFLDELCRIAPRKYGEMKAEARKAMRDLNADRDSEYAGYAGDIVAELQDALSENSPPFLYFGNTEGDGSDFGWWPAWEAIDELDQFDSTSEAADAKHVGEFKVVNDHGNVEIYVRSGNGRITSIMGIV